MLKEEDAGDQLTSDSGDQDKIITTTVKRDDQLTRLTLPMTEEKGEPVDAW